MGDFTSRNRCAGREKGEGPVRARRGAMPRCALRGGDRPTGGKPLAAGHAGREQVFGLCRPAP